MVLQISRIIITYRVFVNNRLIVIDLEVFSYSSSVPGIYYLNKSRNKYHIHQLLDRGQIKKNSK